MGGLVKIDEGNCPECGQPLEGSADWIPGCARMSERSPGVWEHEGYTEVFWDGQVNASRFDEGSDPDRRRIRLQCSQGHEWESRYEEE